MKEKEKKREKNSEDETVELNIEELMDVQGGIEDTGDDQKESCGLGCFLGAGSGGNGNK
ncbi:MAG: hypothetical protein LBT25_06770 [Candidatus Symbiothrix sp.]|jgi:hypothetical protein|nr:hypothetical protein [Candidatus Symbiothrix sp.]